MDKVEKLMARWKAAHERHGFVDESGVAGTSLTGRERVELRREAGVPAWKWCRFGNKHFERRTSRARAIRYYCERWRRSEGSCILSGPTGIGKTLCLVALANKLVDRLGKPLGEEHQRFLKRVRFVRASMLVKAADRWPLGEGEPPFIVRAISASLLLCDDVGNEGPDRNLTLFEVIDRRYMQSAPTVVTTYLDRAELSDRYGDALVRRLTDRGKFVTPAGVDNLGD